MEFRTNIRPTPLSGKIGMKQPILTLGSCFADAIGSCLHRFKFDVLANPFGTTYNPISIHRTLQHALTNEASSATHSTENQGVFYHHDFHSEFSATNPTALHHRIDQAITNAHQHLKKTKWIMITYGTAWVYRLSKSDSIVANCHKIPAAHFSKELLTQEMIVDSFSALHQSLSSLEDVQIILTVSPVRHVKDTLELNSVSKSILRTSCHQLCELFENVHYFPAYEIMMDDLRDYRFYKPDMIHPSDVAEEYIWDHFLKCYVDEPTQSFIHEWKQIMKDLEHKPFHPQTPAHQNFILKVMERIESYKSYVNIEQELKYLKNQLIDKASTGSA